MGISMNLDTCMEISIAAVCDDLDKIVSETESS